MDQRNDEPEQPKGVGRRTVLGGFGAGLGAASLSALPRSAAAQTPAATSTSASADPFPASRNTPLGRPYNVILITTDEEAFHLRPAEGFTTPARAELQQRGTTFLNHYIGSAMCTPSRGVIYSGQPPQVNGVFDQMETGYVPSLRTDRPSMGTVFRQLGYHTAYFGKFELLSDIVVANPAVNYSEALAAYGFQTFSSDGDKVGAPDQGYETDIYTASEAVRWMRTHGQTLNENGIPWLLVVSFISPHDIMYADVNQPGQIVQKSQTGAVLTPPPSNAAFTTRWKFPPSPSALEPLDKPGRPPAQLAYNTGWSAWLGEIPQDATAMWQDYYNFYLNLIRDNDCTLQIVLDAISELNLWSTTAVVRTADHGELGGSHGGLRGKGPLPYEQETHVPMVVVHPEYAGGRSCKAITSHIDLLTTLAGLTNAEPSQRAAALAGLPGRDFSSVLKAPEQASLTAIREGALFNYVGLWTVDSTYMTKTAWELNKAQYVPPFGALRPAMTPRGFLSFCFDGRYKFARYYAPGNFNTPTTFEDLVGNNDLELYDLESDPDEMINLAVKADANRELIMYHNELLNRLIAREVGDNDGSFLPAAVRKS
ncbi:sulfatase-like hydrolase/transferase [Acidisoma cellulosilytica]|uniref:Sulfatase-like hydrolase/transferase n=1 Tax=Acidisoma cellulosilyticum TaxID=2802395 RepID=A0A963Z5T3_9PROT|nr:sulfatase-like hydrolase/transferase [Acidisoma cellulosilyticum]MCB8882353.1 sulfatase-like hydrolase/transferase [Acidisoma cellulosilyticum]